MAIVNIIGGWGTWSSFVDPMTTAWDIIIRNSSNATDRLAIGTAWQVLKVNAWATASERWSAASGWWAPNVKRMLIQSI